MPQHAISRGGKTQRVARAGEHFVVAELNKRGAYAMSFAGNMPKIDLIACNHDQTRTVHIQVKTRSSGRAWQTSILHGRPMSAPANALDETNFWIFVDLGDAEHSPRYWIAPDWWVRNDIHKAHQQYLERHGGHRAENDDSTHHAIEEKRLEAWQNRWDVLAIFDLHLGTEANEAKRRLAYCLKGESTRVQRRSALPT